MLGSYRSANVHSSGVTFNESRPFYPRSSSPSAYPIEDISFLTFSDTPITHVLPSYIHSNVSPCTTVVDPTSSSPVASPHSSPKTSPVILPHPLLYYTSRPHLVNSSDASSFDELSPSTTMSPSVDSAPPPAQPTYGFCARPLPHIDRYGYSSAALLNTTYHDAMLILNGDMRWQRRLLLLNEVADRGASLKDVRVII